MSILEDDEIKKQKEGQDAKNFAAKKTAIVDHLMCWHQEAKEMTNAFFLLGPYITSVVPYHVSVDPLIVIFVPL